MPVSLDSSVRAAGPPRNTQAPAATPGASCVAGLGRIELLPSVSSPEPLGHRELTLGAHGGQGSSDLPRVSVRRDRLLPAIFDRDAIDAPGCTTPLAAY